MEPVTLIGLMAILEKLKNETRHSWTSAGRRESVAEHSWRLALLAYFVRDEFPEADIDKVLRMCLLHDIGEAYTGDIPSFEKSARDEATEEQAIGSFLAGLPEPYRGDMTALFAEMAALETPESKIFLALDKLEAVLQHNEADISTWLPLEYSLQLTYGTAEIEFSDYMRRLKQELNEDSKRKIAEFSKEP
jgi:putative hydrolase of HD superfamily